MQRSLVNHIARLRLHSRSVIITSMYPRCMCNNVYPKLTISRVQPYSTEQSQNPLPPRNRNKDFKGSPISWMSVGAVVVFGALMTYAVKQLRKAKDENIAAKRGVMIGKADLGGDWTLVDHHGNRCSNKDFIGKWVILYFGFSFCPDICPEEMEKLVEIVDRIDDDPSLPNIIPLFVTLDPERDTPVHLAKYVAEFSPKVIGLTGSKEQVAKAAKAYRIYYSVGPKDEDNDYIVDHSIIKYLVSPDGEFCEYFGQNKTAGEVFNSTKKHMDNWRKTHGDK